uniref:Reverse transcriptase domain-containing protein n=1 Tax=Tanacetum cinerariifolium TaxID=118510 RepID=A0A6L2NJU6_TANCI|nr:reverse transcriptase domain-containing protein [Tanacetum cinerariifolium]
MIEEESSKRGKEVSVTKEVPVNPSFLDQRVTIRGGLSEACRDQLKSVLKDNLGLFAWEPSDMTGVSGQIIEHALNVYLSLDLEMFLQGRGGKVSRIHVAAEVVSVILLTDRKEDSASFSMYIKAHPVRIITDYPIKHILSKTETSGKLAKYVVELRAYNITFIPRNAVKGQVLVDFLLEAPKGEKAESYLWISKVLLERDDIEKRADRSLMEGIKTRLGRKKSRWVDELPYVLWAHRTSIKQSNGETPFSLTYDSEAVNPSEIGVPTYQTLMIREEYNKEEMLLNLDLLQERKETAAIQEERYKTKIEQYYNKKVRSVHDMCRRRKQKKTRRIEA